MNRSPYKKDPQKTLHHGAIYEYRPVFWLEPPLWLLRDIQWTPPRRATIYSRSEKPNAFRLHDEGHQENVLARAKIRYVVTLSNDFEARNRGFKEVVVAPTYGLKEQKLHFREEVRSAQLPHVYHLPHDPLYPEMGECYIDFRKIQPLHKGFLREGKLDIAFTFRAMNAILQAYKQYLSLSSRTW